MGEEVTWVGDGVDEVLAAFSVVEMAELLRGWCLLEQGVANLMFTKGYDCTAQALIMSHATAERWSARAGILGVARHDNLKHALARLVARIPDRLDEVREVAQSDLARATEIARLAATRTLADLLRERPR